MALQKNKELESGVIGNYLAPIQAVESDPENNIEAVIGRPERLARAAIHRDEFLMGATDV